MPKGIRTKQRRNDWVQGYWGTVSEIGLKILRIFFKFCGQFFLQFSNKKSKILLNFPLKLQTQTNRERARSTKTRRKEGWTRGKALQAPSTCQWNCQIYRWTVQDWNVDHKDHEDLHWDAFARSNWGKGELKFPSHFGFFLLKFLTA